MKCVIVIPPKDDGVFATREIGDAIYNHKVHLNPYSSVVYATKLRDEYREKVGVFDAQALGLNSDETKSGVKHFEPDEVTYFISAFGIPSDVECVDWSLNPRFVVSPIKTNVEELIEIYSEFPFEEEMFITDPDQFSGRADFSFLDLTKYTFPIRINLSDFCPYQCSFCCRCNMKQKIKSVEDTVEEVGYIINKYGIHDFFLFGSEISIKKDLALKLADDISKHDISFRVLDRVDLVEREVYERLVEAGLTDVAFGVESGSQRCLDYVKKGINPEDTILAFEKTNDLGLIRRAYFIMGFPEEERSDLFDTIKLSWKINPEEARAGMLYPSPGSPFYNRMKEESKLVTERWEYYKHYNRRILAFQHPRYKNHKELLKTWSWVQTLLELRRLKIKNLLFLPKIWLRR